MNTAKGIGLTWVLSAVVVVAGAAGWTGYYLGTRNQPDEPKIVEETKPAQPAPVVEEKPEPEVSEADILALLEEPEPAEPEPKPEPSQFAQMRTEEMGQQWQRWQNMSVEQRQMMRKAMFSAMAKVDGLEEIGDAIREGKFDPRQFRIDPQSIAERMEFYAETMDQESMEREMTATLQDLVDQARSQLK